MPRVIEFDPRRASQEEWACYHAFRRVMHAERRPEEPLPPDDAEEVRMKHQSPYQWERRLHFMNGDGMVASFEVEGLRPESPEYPTNRHIIWAWGYVVPSHRRRGLGRSWLPAALAAMDEHEATLLSSFAEAEPDHAFLRWLGAEPKLVERRSRLDLREVDWDMVARWIAAGESAGGRLEVHPQWVPDELLDEYCLALNELLNTIPFEDLEHGEIVTTPEGVRNSRKRLAATGSLNPTCLVRDADGAIVGMTDVVKHPYEPGMVRQEFTGVHPRARRRGVGRWLKAAMLQHVRQAHPDTLWITTENAGSNDQMLGINHALGFELDRVYTFYQVGRDTLRRAV